MFLNSNFYIECEGNCFIGTACDNQRTMKKPIKNIMMFNDLNKGLGIKFNEQHIRKDECVNEHVGLAVIWKKLKKALHDYEYEFFVHHVI